jgi:hypothetical protein
MFVHDCLLLSHVGAAAIPAPYLLPGAALTSVAPAAIF